MKKACPTCGKTKIKNLLCRDKKVDINTGRNWFKIHIFKCTNCNKIWRLNREDETITKADIHTEEICKNAEELQERFSYLKCQMQGIRKLKFDFYKPKEKEYFFQVVKGAIQKVESWVSELKQISEELELGVLKE